MGVLVDGIEGWWFKHVTEPAIYINTKVKVVSDYVDGDALPAGFTVISDSFTNTVQAALPKGPPAKRQKTLALPYYDTPGTRSKQDLSQWSGTRYTLNRDGVGFCDGFTHGRCFDTLGNQRCWHDPSLAHQCNICLKAGHGGAACRDNPANVQAIVTKGGGRGNKGKGWGNVKKKGKQGGKGWKSGKGKNQ